MPAPRSLRISLPFNPLSTTTSQTSLVSPQLYLPTSPKLSPTLKISLPPTTPSTTPPTPPNVPINQPHSPFRCPRTAPSPPTKAEQTKHHPGPPAQPRSPLPWTWRCHLCHTPYRLSTTRRCLLDGHTLCFGAAPPPGATTSRRRGSRACAAEFDYLGWAAWNTWRRDVGVVGACGGGRGEGSGRDADADAGVDTDVEMKMRRDCWADCDFPSECLQGRGGEGEGVEDEGDEVSPLPLE